MSDSHFKYTKLEVNVPGMLSQELVTYEKMGGLVKKTTITRTFFPEGGWNDTESVKILG